MVGMAALARAEPYTSANVCFPPPGSILRSDAGFVPQKLTSSQAQIVGRRGVMGTTQNRIKSLVARFSQIEGYRCLSLIRAFGVENCQLALVLLALRSRSHAAISSMRVGLSGIRRSRHRDDRTPSSLREFKPTAMLWSVVPFEALNQPRGFSGLASAVGNAS
jgi:hypothetical protein